MEKTMEINWKLGCYKDLGFNRGSEEGSGEGFCKHCVRLLEISRNWGLMLVPLNLYCS